MPASSLRDRLHYLRKRGRSLARWLVRELPHAPGLELYSWGIDRQNRALTRQMVQGGVEATTAYFAPYQNREIPKILWLFWEQGLAEAPLLIRASVAQWRAMNPAWEIRVIDRESAGAWVDMPDLSPALAHRMRANALRLRLLARHGGVWADATTYCHRPLDEWLPLLGGQTGFFTFAGPHRDRWIDNWFIAAHPDTALIRTWCARYDAYVTRLTHTPQKYFMMIYILQWALLRDPALRQVFRSSGALPAVPCYYLMAALEGKAPPALFGRALAQGLPVNKLSHRAGLPGREMLGRLEALTGTRMDERVEAASARAGAATTPDRATSGKAAETA